MKCPHCGYVNGWNPITLELNKGEKGSFYTASNDIKMVRNIDHSPEVEKRDIIGCPNCNKLFMD